MRYQYADAPGQFAPAPMPRRGSRGLPMLRIKGVPTPCCWCPKQPDDVPPHERTPGTAEELTPENLRAYLHYLECKAVGQFPDDDLVRRNAMIIAQAERVRDELNQIRLAALSGGRRLAGE